MIAEGDLAAVRWHATGTFSGDQPYMGIQAHGATIDIEGREIRVGVSQDLARMLERMIPLGRGGTPEDAAGAVYLLCLPESNYVTGQTLICGGGMPF